MALKIEIAVSMSRQRLEALYKLYEWMISQFVPEDNLDHLLFAHTTTMYWQLEITLQKKFQNKSFLFSEPEAIAFCLLWGSWTVTDPFDAVIVNEIIATIDKKAKQPKTIHANNRKHLTGAR